MTTNNPDAPSGFPMHLFGRTALLIDVASWESTAHPVLPAHVADAVSTEWDREPSAEMSLIDVVPAEDTLLLRFDRAIDPATLPLLDGLLHRARATLTPTQPGSQDMSPPVVIPVTYDGADLAEVAHACSMSIDHLIDSHSSTEFTVAFCGFSPGFAYLTGLADDLRLPRRPTPRTRVPAGSVAIAEHYSAVYPRESPGGWHLIGRTRRTLFAPEHDEPALLTPGATVRFRPEAERIEVAVSEAADSGGGAAALDPPTAAPGPGRAHARIDQVGMGCVIEDLGRPGWAHLAVSESGAWDRRSHRLAQRLVGNDENAAGLECVAGGLRLHAREPLTVAITGAPGPVWIIRRDVTVAVATHTPVYLAAGEDLHIGMPTAGLRRYVAIRGGILATKAFASRSTDTLSGLGPDVVSAGMLVHLGQPQRDIPRIDATAPDPASRDVGVIASANWSLLQPATREHLAQGSYEVSPASDRVGIRLAGPSVQWLADARFTTRSRPVVRGAIQVPPDGSPIVFGPDHPATGGYPIIGVLADPDLPAQWAPGVTVHLREVIPFLLAPRAASSTGRAADS